jgi:hypothetical protein
VRRADTCQLICTYIFKMGLPYKKILRYNKNWMVHLLGGDCYYLLMKIMFQVFLSSYSVFVFFFRVLLCSIFHPAKKYFNNVLYKYIDAMFEYLLKAKSHYAIFLSLCMQISLPKCYPQVRIEKFFLSLIFCWWKKSQIH